ncbi:TPA: acetyl-CoA decarbonylase/synthase complex subunit gamma [Candidatus Bipolaricaulota bacterium]|nr:acetyl-CoA decarbonylase/synthase complex subunit gamma [Candidatus Bipolaricaulota bacterium]
MAKRLTGIEIYKLLPRTNCRDCGFPTCMAFAMQVAAKKVALDQCPHVSEEAKAALGEAQAPPMRTVTIGTGDRAWEVGGETVLFRHEEKFHRPCAIAVRVPDDLPPQELSARVKEATSLRFVRIGQEIGVNLIAVEHRGGDFPTAVQAAREASDLPLMLICEDPDLLGKALAACGDGRPLLYPATSGNLEAMAALAVEHSCPLGVKGDGVEGLAALTGKLKELGVEDLVLDPGARGLLPTLTALVHLRRLALVKTFRPVGYPTLAFAVGDDPYELLAQGVAYVCKYASVVVFPPIGPELALPLLAARQNIYTDPQVPNAIEAKLYEVGGPGPDSPVLVTTNFALTYFTVEGEVERSKVPAYIAVIDTEGLGVLNAYADDRLTAEKIIKTVREYGVMDRVNHGKIIIPGLVAVLKMEIQEETGWEVIVGPEDAAGIPAFLKNEWKPN